MKRMQDEDFLEPLKNRPGLKPRKGFKDELATKLQGIEKDRHRIQSIKMPVLIGVAFALIFILFSKDILQQLKVEPGQHGADPRQEDVVQNSSSQNDDIILWNGQIYTFSKKIKGEEIGMKLGEITKKVGRNKVLLKEGEATMVEEGTMVYSVGKTEDIAVKRDDHWMMYQIYGFGGIYITADEAVSIAKKKAPDKEISWDADFYMEPASLHEELVDVKNPVWEVVGTYPLSNKAIFYIDAKTEKLLVLKEMEAEGSIGGNEGLVLIKEINDQFNQTKNTYSGEIIVQISEKAKTEFRKNGASVKVTLSVESGSFTSEAMMVPDPRDENSVPFEFNIKPEDQKAGNFSLVLSIFDSNGVVIYEELKGVTLE